ncbi:hypothetical protein FRC10_002203 [Ceratobasidium sp. 414]|nr:hypothetical protein FRC10_002203 [Ceratobasidium sp. 414]
MKFSAVSVILAAATGLVSAAPVRIYVFTPKLQVPAPDVAPPRAQIIRWGHAAAPAFNLPALDVTAPGHIRPTPTGLLGSPPNLTPDPEWIRFTERLQAQIRDGKVHRGGCRMKGMRTKSLQWGNKLRVILGLPPIDSFHRPSFFVETLTDGNGTVIYRKEIPVNRLPTHHRHHMRPLHGRPPLMIRLSHALASLGPWEGRAVSFVLGCGYAFLSPANAYLGFSPLFRRLGVLLRMLFVFGVLIVRSVRARRAERRIALEEDSVIFVADVKVPIVVETLPTYAEKAETKEATQTNNAH